MSDLRWKREKSLAFSQKLDLKLPQDKSKSAACLYPREMKIK